MIKLEKVSKKFGTGVYGLSDVSFTIDEGEFVFLVGPTGSGKTTIFRLLIRDTIATDGDVSIKQWNLGLLPGNKLPILRKRVGVVFQDLKLLPDRTIYENIILPLDVSGIKQEEAHKMVDDILEQVNLTEHKDKFPIQLSGGELQRAAIARALVLSPEILLADEPTGNLDTETSWEIVKLLSEINKKGTTVIMATHSEEIVKSLGKRVINIEKGRIVKDSKKKVEKDSKDGKEKGEHKEKEKSKEKKDHKNNKDEKEKEEEKEFKEEFKEEPKADDKEEEKEFKEEVEEKEEDEKEEEKK